MASAGMNGWARAWRWLQWMWYFARLGRARRRRLLQTEASARRLERLGRGV